MFIQEANESKTTDVDDGKAYFEAYTREKVYFIAGPEFGLL